MTVTTDYRTTPAQPPQRIALPVPRITYVAYPSSLVLRSANAVQTYATVRALREIAASSEVIIPRFARRPSAFANLGATHLLRIPFNAGRHIIRSTFWSYAERTWFSFRFLARLLRQRVTGSQPDVLYVRDVVCATWLTLCAQRIAGAAVVYEVHDLERENRSANTGPLARWLARWMDRVALGRADGIVSLTETFLQPIAEHAPTRGPHRRPIVVIPDAYDDAIYAPRDKGEARAGLGIAKAAFVVTYSGLTFTYHGVDTLVDAFALFVRDHDEAQLLLVGGRDAEREAIADQVAAHHLSDRVRIVPPQPAAALPAYLAAADVLAIPDTVTKASASPLKLFEYAAMGQPIVAIDLPALHEVLPDDAAVYVPDTSPTAIATGLAWVHAHRNEARARGSRARQAVTGRTYHARARAILEICQRVYEAHQ